MSIPGVTPLQPDLYELVLVASHNMTCPFPERPGPLTLDTLTCPEYTGEGRDVSCRCSHPSTQGGSPPATLAWPPAADSATLHVEAVKRGDPDSATLHMEAVKRGQNGTVRTCLSLWGSQDEVVQSLNYTLLVARQYCVWGGGVSQLHPLGSCVCACTAKVVHVSLCTHREGWYMCVCVRTAYM